MRNHMKMKYLSFANYREFFQVSVVVQYAARWFDFRTRCCAKIITPPAHYKNQPVVLYESRGVYLHHFMKCVSRLLEPYTLLLSDTFI